jgi:cytochrome c peroxidase
MGVPSVRGVDAAALILRVGLGAVLVIFGVEKLSDPGTWVVFVPTWIVERLGGGGIALDRLLRFQGVFELTLGVQLIAGIATRVAAMAAALLLLAICGLLGFNPLAVRDGGLVAASVALLTLGPGRYSADALVAAVRGGASARFGVVPAPLWVVGHAAVLLVFLGAPGVAPSPAAPYVHVDPRYANEPIPPLPRTVPVNLQQAALGGLLFNDPRLSRNNTVACASCHAADAAGADGRVVSIGIDGQLGARNAPTVFNAAFNLTQFWDGRAATLEEQVTEPLTNPLEMGSTWSGTLAKLQRDARYPSLFIAAYPDGLTQANVQHAIAEFERSLITPDAPFDRYVRGERDVLSAQQKRGFEHFRTLGCVTCHQGANAGGTLFHVMGRMRGFFEDRPERAADLGRFNVTGREEDKYKFRVPPLRNVALTGPYFHDGSVSSLREAVRLMAFHQLGYELGDAENDDLVAFLHALTGRQPKL